MKTGVYAGSFDPITKGHQDIIKELNKYIDNNKVEYIEDNNFYKIGYKMELYN